MRRHSDEDGLRASTASTAFLTAASHQSPTQVAEDLPSWAQGVDDDACRAHGFCGGRSKQQRLALLARWV